MDDVAKEDKKFLSGIEGKNEDGIDQFESSTYFHDLFDEDEDANYASKLDKEWDVDEEEKCWLDVIVDGTRLKISSYDHSVF